MLKPSAFARLLKSRLARDAALPPKRAAVVKLAPQANSGPASPFLHLLRDRSDRQKAFGQAVSYADEGPEPATAPFLPMPDRMLRDVDSQPLSKKAVRETAEAILLAGRKRRGEVL